MTTESPIRARVAIGLLLVSALSLLAFVLLSAYASDLRSEQTGGENALSKSAVGFAGIRFLLESAGVDAPIGRTPPALDRYGLVVLTPELTSDRTELKALAGPGPRLIVLPKWITMADPDRPGWVVKLRALDGDTVASVIAPLAPRATISQRHSLATVRFHALLDRYTAAAVAEPVHIDHLQTISGKGLWSMVVDDHGRAVLANIVGTQAFVLSDPDLFNNLGVRDSSVARAAFALPQLLRSTDRPISFDVTLNGFGRSPELLRTIFGPPLLGATLCALLAGALLAFHAVNRFGGARAPDRAFALGKRALADNTAAVIHLMRRETAMASRYADAMLRLVAAQLGALRGHADSAWVASVERGANQPYRFADLRAEASGVEDPGALIRVAKKLYRWRQGVLHERV
jgi:hypothetical protein